MKGTGSLAPSSLKVPLKITNLVNLHEDKAATSQNTEGADGLQVTEKENGVGKSKQGTRGRPKRKVRRKKNKSGNASADQSSNTEDGVSPWLAPSLGPE